jgi:hypothetical protein
LLRRLARETSAVTVIELGVSLPFLMVIALGSMEMVNLGILHVRLNQLAISVADNASRAKQSVVGGAPMFREYDVNQVFTGAALSVDDLDFPTNGRVILSSLETNSSGGQWIHWQRCWGNKTYVSRYGVQGTGATGTSFAGMGQPGGVVTVESLCDHVRGSRLPVQADLRHAVQADADPQGRGHVCARRSRSHPDLQSRPHGDRRHLLTERRRPSARLSSRR